MRKNYRWLQLLNLAFFYLGNTVIASTVTTTAGAVSTSTSGMYRPDPKVRFPIIQNQGALNITPTPPACVDSGIEGRRCGIAAITFCKINPDALNCNTISNQANKK